MRVQRRPARARLTGLDLTPCRRALVVAPHPDDEVLGAGGLVQVLLDAGAAVEIVAVTDGEGSHPHSPTIRPEQLARQRAEEVAAAYRILGLPDGCRHRLGLPDSRVGERERELVAELARMLSEWPSAGLWCVAPWHGDGHPDHVAAGRAARAAARACGVRLLPYLMPALREPTPGDDRLPWSATRRLPLNAEVLRRKRAAVDCFTSQVEPLSEHPADTAVLDQLFLARLLAPDELFLAGQE